MEKKQRTPSANISDSVLFLLRGAKKRRSLAIAKAKMVQGEIGVVPKLVAVK